MTHRSFSTTALVAAGCIATALVFAAGFANGQTAGQTSGQAAIPHHQHGKPDIMLSTGDGIAEGQDTTHWGENRGSVAAVFLAIDIPK